MKIDVINFFTNSKTVWVSENFQNIILSVYRGGESYQNNLIQFTDLSNLKDDTDTQKLVFKDSNVFLEELAGLIQNQINGEAGVLLNDSSANYFYVRGKDNNNYSVLVRWEQAQGLWRCGAYLQAELKLPNIRIFSPK